MPALPGAVTASAIALSFVLTTPALATELALSAPGTDGWRPLEFPSISRHTTYTVVNSEDHAAVRADADCSASALYLPVSRVDLQQTPRLRWQWKIEHGLRSADERVKAGDDFAARVYVMFKFDAEHASFWERARHSVASKLYGNTIPGNYINYVWSSHVPADTAWDNPYSSASKMISLGTGALPQWTEAVVDVAADYRRLFGSAPPPVVAVAVMTDTDNTCQRATAYYAGFTFLSRE